MPPIYLDFLLLRNPAGDGGLAFFFRLILLDRLFGFRIAFSDKHWKVAESKDNILSIDLGENGVLKINNLTLTASQSFIYAVDLTAEIYAAVWSDFDVHVLIVGDFGESFQPLVQQPIKGNLSCGSMDLTIDGVAPLQCHQIQFLKIVACFFIQHWNKAIFEKFHKTFDFSLLLRAADSGQCYLKIILISKGCEFRDKFTFFGSWLLWVDTAVHHLRHVVKEHFLWRSAVVMESVFYTVNKR